MLHRMRFRQAVLACLVVVLTAPLGHPARGDEPIIIRLDPTERHQPIDGFGVSGAWWSRWFGELPDDVRRHCLELLFTEHGAGLDIFRYNIPAGGGDEIRSRSHRTPDIETAPGEIDILRDEAGLGVARAVRALGVTRFVAFANSPPARLTINGLTSGGPEGGPNLRPGAEGEFAIYLVDVAEALRKELDLQTIRLSPINEPQWDWGGKRRHQEGCHYQPAQVVVVLKSVLRQIDERSLPITVDAPESGAWNRSIEYAKPMFADPAIAKGLHSFAVHSYWSDADAKRAFRSWMDANHPDVHLVMSEYCEMRPERDLGMQSGLHVAGVIHDDMTLGRVTEWQWWLALAGGRFCDGLIDIAPNRPEIRTTKRLWALAHWSRFVQPGSTRVGASAEGDLLVSAYEIPGKDLPHPTYAIVIVNPTEQTHPLSLEPGESGWLIDAAYVTDDARDMEPTTGAESPARSIMTLVVSPAGEAAGAVP